MSSNKGLALGFEFLDIEIIDHKKESGMSNGKWNCDECSLFFLSKEKLAEHKNKHLAASQALKCQYCNKTLPVKIGNKESYAIRKCNTCEYKCTKCPMRFQRHSSLVNHGKTHLQKKKKCVIKRKSHVIKSEAENLANKTTRKRKTEKEVSGYSTNIEKNGNDNVTVSLSPKKRRKTLPSQIHDEKLVPRDSNDYIKTKKKSVSTINETPDTKIHRENKQNNYSGPTDSGTASSHDSIVNYKPFSCHVCGDNFASGESLLQHIQSHGENVSQGFKCKHCGDAFEDIYKMQYHLAICPLAEDETSLVKNIPVRLHTPASTGSPRKKGRPKKIKTEKLSESSSYDLTPSLSTRGSIKKRNTENKPEISLENEFVDSNCDGMESVGVDNIEEDPLGGVDVASKNVNHSSVESYETLAEDVTKVHSCPFPRCGIKFSREKALLCHMRNHSDVFEDSFKCHKCDIPFDDIHSLRIHLNECKDIKEENDDNLSEPDYADEYNSTDKPRHTFQRKKGDHKCNTRGKVFASQDKLKRCLHNTVGRPETIHPCRLCREIYDNEELLKKHFRSAHSLNLPFLCSVCHVEFDSKTAEAEHYLTHLDGETLKCIICSLKLPTYKDLYFHYKQDHVTKQQSICKMCNKIFPNQIKLLNHTCEEEVLRNKCLFCQRSFRSKASLNVHIKRHTNKKIIKCKICYRAFFDTGDLVKHMLFHASITANERPFKCCLCFVSFKQKVLLASHIKNSHIGKHVSDLKCPVCEDKSNDVKMMVSHLINHCIRIAKNDVSNLEIKWMEQLKSKSNERAHISPLPKRGRPRKLNNTIQSATSNNNSENGVYKYNTRKSYSKINSESSDSTNSSDSYSITKRVDDEDQRCKNEVNGCFNEHSTNNGNLTIMLKQKSKPGNSLSTRNVTHKMNYKVNNLNGCSDKSVKANTGQFRAQQRKLPNIETSKHMNTDTSQRKSISSKPMSFLKIKSVKSLAGGTITPNQTSKTTACTDLEESFGTKQQMANNYPSPPKYILPDFESDGDITIKNEELMITTSPIDYLSENENYPDSDFQVKSEKEDIPMGGETTLLHMIKNKDEESECFIKEKKYYEPSLGLTKYSCTTCLLSFPSQDELLYHNTQHIL